MLFFKKTIIFFPLGKENNIPLRDIEQLDWFCIKVWIYPLFMIYSNSYNVLGRKEMGLSVCLVRSTE